MLKLWNALVLAALVVASPASASFHTFAIAQIYSNADGTAQYVLLREIADLNGQNFLAGHTLTGTTTSGTQVYTFATNLSSSATAGKYVLLATAGFSVFSGISSDYTLPAGFLSTRGGNLNFADVSTLNYGQLPTTGTDALNADGTTATAAPINFAGSRGALTGTAAPPDSGWWYNSSIGGRGFSLEYNATSRNIFFGAYLYEATGSAVWYVGTCAYANLTCASANLTKYSGGTGLTTSAGQGNYVVPTTSSTVGTFQITLTSTSAATLVWPGGTENIVRYPFNGTTIAGTMSGGPQTGWWYSTSEAGRGWFIETQTSTSSTGSTQLFLAGYMYGSSGAPVWYVASGVPTASGGTVTFSGSLIEYFGGTSFNGSAVGLVQLAQRGTVSIVFSSSTAGTLALPSGAPITLQRYSNF